MALLLFAILVCLVALASWSIWVATRLLWSRTLPRKRRNALIGLLVIGVLLGLYLSLGCVWSSEHLRVSGFPLPWGAWQRDPDGRWFDYVSPWSLCFPPADLVLWVGVSVAPITVGEWRKRRKRPRVT
jgi:MFS family permease